MRLSKRERFLLAVLTLLLLWTGFYKFWIEPETDLLFANLQEINRLEEQIKRGGPQGKQNLEQMAEKQGVTEELKVQNRTKWVRLMNNIKASAEEMVLREILYI